MGVGTVLVVHSDRGLRAQARAALEGAGYGVREAPEASDPRLLVGLPAADLVLLEWPGTDRIEDFMACWKPRGRPPVSRVILLAKAAAMREAVSALERGADDCLREPFEGEELAARVRAALRRPPAPTSEERLAAGPIVLDRGLHAVAIDGQPVVLAPTEFRLLAFFLENPDRVFSRAELLRRAWTKELGEGQQRTVDVHVRRLRQMLERFRCEHVIQTVRGFGYRFSAVQREPMEAVQATPTPNS
jgi:two-component system phosphate regulon response regulator PhoB